MSWGGVVLVSDWFGRWARKVIEEGGIIEQNGRVEDLIRNRNRFIGFYFRTHTFAGIISFSTI